MLLGLRIAVNSYRGTLQGVPRLVDILRRNSAGASFLFSFGPDRTGRTAFGPLKQRRPAGRIPLLQEYGFKSLLYGTLLPGPTIGKRGADIMRATRDAGFECAIQGWERCDWLSGADRAGTEWTEIEMRRAYEQYAEIFGTDTPGHGAFCWQMNRHALRMTQRLNLTWSSDCRGSHPFLPVWNGEPVRCPQLPTTLPTLAELVGQSGITPETVVQPLLQITGQDKRSGHVFALSAELEGLSLAPCFEELLTGWREQGYRIVALGTLRESFDLATLPRHEVMQGSHPGRRGNVLLQGPEFLADWKEAA